MRIKPHRKTRTGCFACKKRRVKCDEANPSCSNCQARTDVCQYPDRPASTTPSLQHLSRQLEIRLSHQWCTETCQSFTAKQIPLLRDHAIEKAQEHTFLMDAIFALAAAHLASENKPASKPLLQASLQYHTNAVAALRGAVETSDLEAVFLASILTMATSVVLPLLHEESAAQCLLHIHEFLKGVRTIIDMNPIAFRNGRCATMFGQTSSQECTASEDDMSALRWLRELKNTYAAHDKSYDLIVDELELCFTYNQKRAISWVSKVGQGFIDAVCHREPFALLVLAYWGASLCRLEGMWWARYAGQILLRELTNTSLRPQYEPWAAAMLWAKEQGGNGDNDHVGSM